MKRNEFFKVVKWILISIGIVIAGLAYFIYIGLIISKDYENKQTHYFDRVSYQIEGKILEMKNVGGIYYLIKILPEKFDLHKNELSSKDDCIGTIPEGSKYIYIIAPYTHLDEDNIPQFIKLDTNDRSLVFDNNQTTTLSTSGSYRRKLPSVNDEKCIHF